MLFARIGFSLLFGFAGLYLVNVARRLWLRHRDWQVKGVDVEGKIVGFEERTATGDRVGYPTFAPIVRFHTKEGAGMTFTSSMSSRPNPYVAGQTVAVKYMRDDPNDAELASAASSWWTFIIVIIFIVVVFTVASLPIILPPPHR